MGKKYKSKLEMMFRSVNVAVSFALGLVVMRIMYQRNNPLLNVCLILAYFVSVGVLAFFEGFAYGFIKRARERHSLTLDPKDRWKD